MSRRRTWNALLAPRRTVRMRFTALYTALFLAISTILLVVVNLLLDEMLKRQVDQLSHGPPLAGGLPPPSTPTGRPVEPGGVYGSQFFTNLPGAVLHYQWTVAAIAIAVLAVVSVIVGWWLAGRLLRPLRGVTAAARRMSLSNLHERIAMTGPQDELKDLADTFDSMLERLERSVESQRRFIANAAHELRTPLATQRAAIEIGLEDLPSHLTLVREKLLAANRRSESLIDSLLILAQADHGIDNAQLVDLALLTRQTMNEALSHDLDVTLDLHTATTSGDPMLLGRLLTNLLHNASRYNRPGGQVHVGLSPAGELRVRNTGPRIPPERVTELFRPFHRLHNRTTDGAGLGLSIVASIARAHHATITAHPNPDPDGGLDITVQFPPSDTTSTADHRAQQDDAHNSQAGTRRT